MTRPWLISQVNPAPDRGGPAEHVPSDSTTALGTGGGTEPAASGAEGLDVVRGNAISAGHRHRCRQSLLSRHGLSASGERSTHTPGKDGSRADVSHVSPRAMHWSPGDSCNVEAQELQAPSTSVTPRIASGGRARPRPFGRRAPNILAMLLESPTPPTPSELSASARAGSSVASWRPGHIRRGIARSLRSREAVSDRIVPGSGLTR